MQHLIANATKDITETTKAPLRFYTKQEAIDIATKWFGGDDLAADTWVRKYALKKSEEEYAETTPDQMFDRMVKALVEVEKPEDRGHWAAIYREQLSGFNKVVMQGSPMMGLGNTYYKSTLSNCYVVPIKDDTLKSMFDALYEMAQIQAFRGGVGIDISPLRPEGAKVNNAALASSGAWSWADMFSYVTHKVGQNGRRGALMLTLDVSHPDIEKFVAMKSDLGLVTGANVSVKLTNEFMNAVENDDDFELIFNFKNNEYKPFTRTVKARELWGRIVHYATNYAEPGILMWDTILRRSPADCYHVDGFGTICTNPCSEIPLSAYDSCRLTSLNLTGYVINPYTTSATFDWDAFGISVQCGIRMLDNMVDLDIPLQPFEAQRKAALQGRRLGLGTHGLGDMLTMMGIKYDSDEGVEFIDDMYGQFKELAYEASIDLAEERGAFPLFDWEKEKDNEYINELPDHLLDRMKKVGRRNIAMLTCAPTGSVSVVSQTSSGIEPIFAYAYDRRVKIFGSDKEAATEVDSHGDHWRKWRVFHHGLRNSMHNEIDPALLDVNNDLQDIVKQLDKNLPEYWVTSDKINWRKRVDVQAAITRHLDHASSSTINLPKGTGEDVVGGIYQYAWKKNLKGVTVYVDGSRDGVLLTGKADVPDERPAKIDAVAHVVGNNGSRYTVFVGLVDKKPYEVFCCKHTLAGVSDALEGEIVKVKSRHYNFESGPLVVRQINEYEDNEISIFTRLVSTMLRNNIPLDEVNDQLNKSKGSFGGLPKAINRVLAKYYLGIVEGKICPDCAGSNTRYEEGCMTCRDCGHSGCS